MMKILAEINNKPKCMKLGIFDSEFKRIIGF